jgi:hypothetical protein
MRKYLLKISSIFSTSSKMRTRCGHAEKKKNVPEAGTESIIGHLKTDFRMEQHYL